MNLNETSCGLYSLWDRRLICNSYTKESLPEVPWSNYCTAAVAPAAGEERRRNRLSRYRRCHGAERCSHTPTGYAGGDSCYQRTWASLRRTSLQEGQLWPAGPDQPPPSTCTVRCRPQTEYGSHACHRTAKGESCQSRGDRWLNETWLITKQRLEVLNERK